MFGGSKNKQFYLESIKVKEQTKRFAEGFLDERIDVTKISSLELHEIANKDSIPSLDGIPSNR